MGTSTETVVLFEGIATIDVDGVAHDAYIKIKSEVFPGAVRWLGTFEWMGPAPDNFKAGGFHDVALSDGRECQIRIPAHQPEMDHLQFLGTKLPPGFEMFVPEMVTAEIRSTTLPRWRVWLSRVYAFAAFCLMVAGIWVPSYRWQYLTTGLVFSFVSLTLATPSKGRPLKEVKSDGDS